MQAGFFDLDDRYRQLDKLGDPAAEAGRGGGLGRVSSRSDEGPGASPTMWC